MQLPHAATPPGNGIKAAPSDCPPPASPQVGQPRNGGVRSPGGGAGRSPPSHASHSQPGSLGALGWLLKVGAK